MHQRFHGLASMATTCRAFSTKHFLRKARAAITHRVMTIFLVGEFLKQLQIGQAR